MKIVYLPTFNGYVRAYIVEKILTKCLNELEVLELEAIEYDDKMEKYYPGYKNMSHRERKNLILPESDNEDY